MEDSPAHPSDAPPERFSVGVVLAVVGTFLFALKSIFIKLAFAEGVGPTELLTVRLTLALPFYVAVLAVLLRRHDRTGSRRKLPPAMIARALAIGLLGYYLAAYLDLCGLTYISAQLERLTLFTYPTMVAVLAWMFLGEQLTPRIVLALALSYLGVWFMYGQERLLTTGGNVGTGVLLVLGSALSYSLYLLFAKPIMQKIGSREFTSLAMIGSTAFVAAHYTATRPIDALLHLPGIVYVYGVVLAFVCTVVPSFMINESIVRIGATRTTVIGTIGPVLTMLLAIFILREPSSWHHAAGMAMAVLGVSLVAVK